MQCLSCGQFNAANAKFCGNCGAPLPPAKKPFPWVWVGAGAGGLLVLILVLVFAFGGSDDYTPPGNQPTPPTKQADQKQPTPAPAKKSSLANSYFVGKWRCWAFSAGNCPVGWEDLQIRADGTYTLAQKLDGTWTMQGDKAVFDGPLAFAGPAEKYKTDQFQFNYTDKSSGYGAYILFVKY